LLPILRPGEVANSLVNGALDGMELTGGLVGTAVGVGVVVGRHYLRRCTMCGSGGMKIGVDEALDDNRRCFYTFSTIEFHVQGGMTYG